MKSGSRNVSHSISLDIPSQLNVHNHQAIRQLGLLFGEGDFTISSVTLMPEIESKWAGQIRNENVTTKTSSYFKVQKSNLISFNLLFLT